MKPRNQNNKKGSDKRLICLVCGNSTWREIEISVEPKRDHHFHIADSTKEMIRERCIAKYGTYDAGLRAIIESYDLFMAYQEKDKLREFVYTRPSLPIRGMTDVPPTEEIER
jgi:hypothetical protein